MLVLDASVTLSWVFPEEQSDYSTEVFTYVARAGALVPQIWVLEVLNALVVAERARRLTAQDANKFLGELLTQNRSGRISMTGLEMKEIAEDVAGLARRYKLTAYDATYLQLAEREHLPLASFDERLIAAAKQHGTPLWKPRK